MRRSMLVSLVLAIGLAASPAGAQQIPVQEHVLENGMTLLMVPRPGDPNVAAGWIARVGSVNERPGITGMSHLFEHMMFKGTKTLGATDFEEDERVRARLDDVKARLRVEEQEQLRRYRLGEIDDLADPAGRSAAHQKLLEELVELEARERELIVKNEFDRIYTAAGASGMNAGTAQDFTIYFINVPANKLELWFWMEADRLLNPVFREFYAEREVVREERRMRIESTPIGKYEEQFDALFWNASPYGWPVVGWPSDIERITREEALAYYDLNYAPNNIAACLVGDFDPAEAIRLAERYFGRLKRNPTPPPPVRTQEVPHLAERRMIAHAETSPQVEMRFLTVADGHRDEAALTVLGSLLSGRTGRLYKSLVLEQKIATGARAGQNSLKWQGYFSAGATATPGGEPRDVEQAILREIEKLQDEAVDERELQKVKNQFAADAFRRVQNNFFLMLQLLLAENNRGWQAFNEDPKRIEAVTAADVQRVAGQYLKPETRTVALYYTQRAAPAAPGETPDPTLEGLSDAERQQVAQMRTMVAKMPVEQAREFLAKLEEAEAGAPEDKRRLLSVLKAILQERIEKGGE